MDCVFCKIVDGEIPSDTIYEDEHIIAFNDLDPQAPIHFLVIPKEHITSLAELDASNSKLISHIMISIAKIAKEQGLDSYRVVTNIGEDGGQTVPHLHFHVLGGRSLNWPPGWFATRIWKNFVLYERGDRDDRNQSWRKRINR